MVTPAAYAPYRCCSLPAVCWNKVTQSVKNIFQELAGYLLKICVFRDAALQGRFSQSIVTPIARGVINLWMKCQNIPNQLPKFDATRLDRSAKFLAEFADIQEAPAGDGTTVKWALYTPEKFNQWVEANGGVRDGEWIFPKTDADWEKLERLEEFRWFEKVGKAFRVPAPIAGANERCILRCQGFGRKMPMDKAFIGLHLAAGFNYALFDWRDEVSAAGYQLDAKIIYQALLNKGFSADKIKAMGSCRSTFVVGYLKQLYGQDGLDAVMIHTQPSLRSAIAHQKSCIARNIGLFGLPAIEKDGAHFDTLRRFREMEPGPSRTCFIMSEGDQTVPQEEADQLVQEARRVGNCTLIVEKKKEGAHDPHFDEPLRNPEVLASYLQFMAL